MSVSLDEIKGASLNMPRNVSAFHLIHWVFAIRLPLTHVQLSRIQNMYGQPKQIINPVVWTQQEFHKTINLIMSTNKLCSIKVVVDEAMIEQIMFASKDYSNILDIYQYQPKINRMLRQKTDPTLYSYNKAKNNFNNQAPPAYSSQITGKKKKSKTKLKVFHQFEQLLGRAEREVQKFTKSFRTFENSHLLIDDFDKINRYRFRLISFINIKISDFEHSFKIFERFSINQLGSLNSHLEGMNKGQIGLFKLKSNLQAYYELASSYISKSIQKASKSNFSLGSNENNADQDIDKQDFSHSILSIYQEQGIFYHLLNSNLKTVGEQHSMWRELSLPFSHVYNSIKYLYKHQIANQTQFYLNPFEVFRGGRVRKSEINQYNQNAGKAFIEFYGFLSTSQSAKIVADRFVTYRDSRDACFSQETDGQFIDEQVIFRIKVKPNLRILHEKYDYLVNGYYRMGEKQKHGSKQKQVLFNALNIFKIVKVQKLKMIDLFNQDEIKSIKRKEQKMKEYSHCKYKECEYRLNYYQNQITVIDLQFGSFYDALLEQNNFNLQKQEKEAKQNYIIGMNKIRKFEQFDEGDACELTNDLQGAYKYLKSKVGKDNQSYEFSRIDNKNYFTRLTTVCRKLGKVNEAINCNQISIKCYKQLKSIYLNEVYNSHYEKLFDMQLKSIEIYKEYSCHLKAQQELKDQLDLIRSKKFNEPKAKLKESQVYINQAINYYSLGMLQESINRFEKCSHQIKKTISTYSLDNEQQSCQLLGFIKNIFCKEDNIERTCSYSEYMDMLRQRREKEMVKRYGSKQELQKTSKLATDMLQLTNQAVKNKKTLFKSRKQYESFINQCNQTISRNKFAQNQGKTKQQQKQYKIMMKIVQLRRFQPQSEKYHQLLSGIYQSISELDQFKNVNLSCNYQDCFLTQLISKFKDKQIKRRVKKLTDSKNEFLSLNRRDMLEKLMRCAKEIQKSITQLKKQGYVEYAIPILQKRNRLAKIYLQCSEPLLAKKQIGKILKSEDFQSREMDLAIAYMTKGKIHLQVKQIKLAVQSFSQAVLLFEKAHRKQYQDDLHLDVSVVTVANMKNDEEVVVDERYLHHNNDYLEARILKSKALLMWIENAKNQQKKSQFSNVFQRFNEKKPWYKRDSTSLIQDIKRQILDLRRIIRTRSKLEDLQELKCALLEIDFQFTLNLPQNSQKMENTFTIFEQCIKLQKKSNVLKASLVCCQFVLRYYERQNVLQAFIQKGYIGYLHKVLEINPNASFIWKIFKALYLIQYELEGRNTSKGVEYLLKAINELKKIKKQYKSNKYISSQIRDLKLKSREYQFLQPMQSYNLEQIQFNDETRLAINRESKISVEPTNYTLENQTNTLSNNRFDMNQLSESLDVFNELPFYSNIQKNKGKDDITGIQQIMVRAKYKQGGQRQLVNPQSKIYEQVELDLPSKVRLKPNFKKLEPLKAFNNEVQRK